MTASKQDFQRKLERALNSPRLAVALGRALPTFREKRGARMEEVDWPALRDDLTKRKRAAIDDLPALIARFTEEAEAVGAKVYRAADAEEARRIVGGLCRAKKAKLVVESKSMATEEIHLNEHLQALGVTPVETDLGEWIIQRAHPAARQLPQGRHRDHRREHPHRGDRNARPCHERGQRGPRDERPARAHRPRRHREDRPDPRRRRRGAELLARSATGQKISTYTQFITGPSRSADIELARAPANVAKASHAGRASALSGSPDRDRSCGAWAGGQGEQAASVRRRAARRHAAASPASPPRRARRGPGSSANRPNEPRRRSAAIVAAAADKKSRPTSSRLDERRTGGSHDPGRQKTA